MSKEGIQKAAKVFEFIQQTRIELLGMGAKSNDHQDIYLGQMLETAHRAIVNRFEELTLMEEKKKNV